MSYRLHFSPRPSETEFLTQTKEGLKRKQEWLHILLKFAVDELGLPLYASRIPTAAINQKISELRNSAPESRRRKIKSCALVHVVSTGPSNTPQNLVSVNIYGRLEAFYSDSLIYPGIPSCEIGCAAYRPLVQAAVLLGAKMLGTRFDIDGSVKMFMNSLSCPSTSLSDLNKIYAFLDLHGASDVNSFLNNKEVSYEKAAI